MTFKDTFPGLSNPGGVGTLRQKCMFIVSRRRRHQQLLGEFDSLPELIVIGDVITVPRFPPQEMQQEKPKSVAQQL